MTIQIVLTHNDPENKISPSSFNTLPALKYENIARIS